MTDAPILVTIGQRTIAVPVMNFAALEQAWPAIQALAKGPDMIGQAGAAIAIVAAAVQSTHPELTADQIKQDLVGTQFVGLVKAVPALLAASGLVPAAPGDESGEAPPA